MDLISSHWWDLYWSNLRSCRLETGIENYLQGARIHQVPLHLSIRISSVFRLKSSWTAVHTGKCRPKSTVACMAKLHPSGSKVPAGKLVLSTSSFLHGDLQYAFSPASSDQYMMNRFEAIQQTSLQSVLYHQAVFSWPRLFEPKGISHICPKPLRLFPY